MKRLSILCGVVRFTLFWTFQCIPSTSVAAIELLSPPFVPIVGKGERMPVDTTGTSRLAMERLPSGPEYTIAPSGPMACKWIAPCATTSTGSTFTPRE